MVRDGGREDVDEVWVGDMGDVGGWVVVIGYVGYGIEGDNGGVEWVVDEDVEGEKGMVEVGVDGWVVWFEE